MAFTFIDLFSGIGGFHAALSSFGGECVFASDIDDRARAIYERNWGDEMRPYRGKRLLVGDIEGFTTPTVRVPKHDVLAAGFPCQPFSKSGYQLGMDEARGTLFWHIARIIEARRPSLVVLENVRNIAGPRHKHEWEVIIRTLRDLGYRVSAQPAVFSPHLLPPSRGGTPQVRERVFITATLVGADRAHADALVPPPITNRPVDGWDKNSWDLTQHLLQPEGPETAPYRLGAEETAVIDVWDDFVQRLLEAREGKRLPGFPLWAEEFRVRPRIPSGTPVWKADFLRKNSEFYRAHREVIDDWLAEHNQLEGLAPSRRKLEWQAQDAASLWDTVMHFRPSGIRAKLPTYVPALVAITQTSIVGPRRRRITPREAARLQGFPDHFGFGGQRDADTYRQLGNAVCVGAVQHVVREHVRQNAADLPRNVREAVLR
jgi:DNA (cytosine-5)-methyltransferase 1